MNSRVRACTGHYKTEVWNTWVRDVIFRKYLALYHKYLAIPQIFGSNAKMHSA